MFLINDTIAIRGESVDFSKEDIVNVSVNDDY